MLVFKFSKNEKGDKKRGDMMEYVANKREDDENPYKDFKQITEETSPMYFN